MHRSHRTEHIGKRAVPAFFERLDGDDEFDRGFRVQQVDPVQLALRAGGDGDALGLDLLLLDQELADHFKGDFVTLVFGLDQDDGMDKIPVQSGQVVQFLAGEDAVAHGFLPGVVFGQDDGQLDHLLGLEFQRRNRVQDVAAGGRGGGELDDAGRLDALQDFDAQLRSIVVGFIDDDQRAMQRQQVAEAVFDRAALQAFQAGGVGRDADEMRLQILVVGIDLAAFGAVDAQGLQRADHNDDFILQVLRAELGEVGDVNHQQLPAKDCFERQAVRMAGLLECGERLGADGVGGHHPQDHGMFLFEVGLGGHGDAARRQVGLAAAGGQAQAHEGHVFQPSQGAVGGAFGARVLLAQGIEGG